MSLAEPAAPEPFLTRRQRRAPFSLPADPTDEELAANWTLSEADTQEILKCRGDPQRRRFAVQLCALANAGRFLRPQDTPPVRLLNHLAAQLGLPPVLTPDPPPKADTEQEHLQRLRAYRGYCPFDTTVQQELEPWVLARAAEGVLPQPLFMLVEEELVRHRRVVLPAPATLERVVAIACARAREVIFQDVAITLSLDTTAMLDALLAAPEGSRRSRLFRFREYPPEATPQSIGDFIARLHDLETLGVDTLDLPVLHAEMLSHLADAAKGYDAQALKRFAPPKRYTLVACFLVDQYKTLLDQVVEMHAQYMGGMIRRSDNTVAATRRRLFPPQRVRETSDTLRDGIALVLAHFQREDVLPRAAFFTRIGEGRAWQAVERYDECRRLDDRGIVDALLNRHSHLRRYLPAFLQRPFAAQPGSEYLLAAIQCARALPSGMPLPDDATERVVPPKLRSALPRTDGTRDRRLWEIGLSLSVRDALRSGDLYLSASKRHVSFPHMVYSEARWATERSRAYADLGLPAEPAAAVQRLRASLEAAVTQARESLPANPFVTVQADGLHLHRGQEDRYQPSVAVRNLRRVIQGQLSTVRIEDLLSTVEARCGFLRELRPRGGGESHIKDLRVALTAALVAHGTNLGIAAMGLATDQVTVDTLQTVTKACLHADTLRAANAVIVDYIHRLPFSALWGTGAFSSSDGQRFPIRQRSLLGAFCPRYFGYYERAVTVYTHMSDQFSVFSTQAISCSEREALYVLEGLLEHDTVLRHRSHTTDTHGYTEQLFGLCYLLGFAFMPRIADLADQQLYTPDPPAHHGPLAPIFRGTVDMGLIGEQWDQLVRMAASIQHQTAKAHDVMQRLVSSGPADRLAKALTALGRLVKTAHILRYIADPALRGAVQLQLNRDEARHALARRLFFAELGEFLRGDYAEIMNKASCLSLLSNAVAAWNIAEMGRIVDRLRAQGEVIVDEELAHVWPLARRHIIPHGSYHFREMEGERSEG
jgi:TnpA family transposase